MKSLYSFSAKTIDGKEQPLADYKGKTLLIVNTASRCGFTPQYTSLETLYKKYHDQGLEVLGFPANNFLFQEPGSNADIKKFCSLKYNVTFPMFSKISVKGKDIHPLYAYLTKETDFKGGITWNFNKFLVSPEGKVVARFDAKTEPLSPELISKIEGILPKKNSKGARPLFETEKGPGTITVLITGASAGIGYELALRFAREGYRLILVSRNKEKLLRAAGEIREKHGKEPLTLPKDLSRPGSAAQVFLELQSRNTRVDILVNNAGVGMHGLFWDADPQRQFEMMQLNMISLTEMTKLFLGPMLKSGKGKILNVASTAAFQPGPLMAVYYATKAYVLSLTEALAEELKGTGVTASVLCPGPTRSDFQEISGMSNLRLFKLTMMEAAPVADAAYRGLRAGKTLIIPGFINKITPLGARLFPRKIITALVRFFQKK